jgi:ABC-type antimicrobial peptide transport system permease subunit
VVGVVGDFVVRSVGERGRQEHLWIPLDQSGWASAALAIRTAGDPSLVASAVRTAVTRVDPDLPIARLMTMDRVIRDRMFQGRVFGTMFAIFGLAALALASIGLYGVMSYSVAQRTQEMGVRIALGAQSQQVVKLVLGSGVRMVGIGIAIGVPAAIGLAQLLRSQLYGISTTDPLTFGVVPLVLVGVALVASLIPARRATRVDPLIAMRSE